MNYEKLQSYLEILTIVEQEVDDESKKKINELSKALKKRQAEYIKRRILKS